MKRGLSPWASGRGISRAKSYFLFMCQTGCCFSWDLVLSRFQNSLTASGLGPSWHAGRIPKHLGPISRRSPSTCEMRTPASPSVSPSCHRYQLGSVFSSCFTWITQKPQHLVQSTCSLGVTPVLDTCCYNNVTTWVPAQRWQVCWSPPSWLMCFWLAWLQLRC
jgi:hypothetical protein